MDNPVRILTHKAQRKLTSKQVVSLLNEYVETDATYKIVAEKYGISPRTVSQVVRGFSYRDLLGIATLRKKAQEKAATRSAKYSNASALQVTDPSLTAIEVNFNSVASVDTAILRLQAVRSLIRPAAEVSL
jgi:hypothetical protein